MHLLKNHPHFQGVHYSDDITPNIEHLMEYHILKNSRLIQENPHMDIKKPKPLSQNTPSHSLQASFYCTDFDHQR